MGIGWLAIPQVTSALKITADVYSIKRLWVGGTRKSVRRRKIVGGREDLVKVEIDSKPRAGVRDDSALKEAAGLPGSHGAEAVITVPAYFNVHSDARRLMRPLLLVSTEWGESVREVDQDAHHQRADSRVARISTKNGRSPYSTRRRHVRYFDPVDRRRRHVQVKATNGDTHLGATFRRR
jgi:hypothetical protein